MFKKSGKSQKDSNVGKKGLRQNNARDWKKYGPVRDPETTKENEKGQIQVKRGRIVSN